MSTCEQDGVDDEKTGTGTGTEKVHGNDKERTASAGGTDIWLVVDVWNSKRRQTDPVLKGWRADDLPQRPWRTSRDKPSRHCQGKTDTRESWRVGMEARGDFILLSCEGGLVAVSLRGQNRGERVVDDAAGRFRLATARVSFSTVRTRVRRFRLASGNLGAHAQFRAEQFDFQSAK